MAILSLLAEELVTHRSHILIFFNGEIILPYDNEEHAELVVLFLKKHLNKK